ncbi:MAG: hypothetical protein GY745_00410 [Actinomycetia bacterium]|nr:hypothetical protein [Actinomycetes bacterium]MCP4083509.1 hypothetical protein [Actinomycetes bacterium]
MELSKRVPARVLVALVGVLVLLVTGCGSAAETSERIVASSTTTVPPAPTTTLGEPLQNTSGASARVAAAFAALEQGRPYRVATSAGQVLEIAVLGIDQTQELDSSRPTSILEVNADGDSYFFVDMGPVLAPLVAGLPDIAAKVDATHLEIWVSRDRMVIDATGYQPIADLNPGQDLGPYAPGVGFIDLEALGGLGGQELVEALIGSSALDPVQMAEQLPSRLGAVTEDPEDPGVFRAQASYGDVVRAMGGDVVSLSRGLAVGIAPTIRLSVDELAGFYQHFYEATPTEVVITITDDGAISSIGMTTDMSGIYEAAFDPDSGLDIGLSAGELADTQRMFADSVNVIETLSVFELDDSITIDPPDGDLEDRTGAAATFFAELVAD